jgi:two-component system, cell cycle sensor histidine kinase and response regulator CckA
LEAREPHRALEMLRACATDIHLLVTDLMMPGMSGHTLITHCRQFAPGLPVVIMSGAADDHCDEWHRLDGSVRFVGKPFSAVGLLREIRDLLDSGIPQT